MKKEKETPKWSFVSWLIVRKVNDEKKKTAGSFNRRIGLKAIVGKRCYVIENGITALPRRLLSND